MTLTYLSSVNLPWTAQTAAVPQAAVVYPGNRDSHADEYTVAWLDTLYDSQTMAP
jgi:hypothetical protein